MATGDIGTPQWQISGTPEWQAETDLVHVSGKLQVAPYAFFRTVLRTYEGNGASTVQMTVSERFY